mgnify:CR=1 FL=1
MSPLQNSEKVNHPKHYNNHPSGVEAIDVIQYMNFCLGNAFKYVYRYKDKNGLEDLKKANVNSTFNYNALTKGRPLIQAGDYSIVPMLYLAAISGNSNFFNYNVKLDLNIYRGPGFKLVSKKSYDLPIKYQLDSKFQFIKNISTLDINDVDRKVNGYFSKNINNFLFELKCQPLEGTLAINEGKLIVDLGKKQGLRQKQIGIVKGINIENSMLNNSSVIVHTREVYDNYSVLLPLNDNIKLANLDKMVVEFVE